MRRRVILSGAVVVTLVVGIFLVRPDPLANVDYKVFDLLTRQVSRGRPSGRVAVVEIDEKSLAQLGRWPWPRDVLGRLVGRILDSGAATVALDMMLHEKDHGTPNARIAQTNGECGARTNDDALVCALTGRPVVVGYGFHFDEASRNPSICSLEPLPLAVVGPKESWGTGFFHASGALCTVPQISRAAAGNGFLNASPDSDGKLRRVPLLMEYGDRQYPSLALA